jgi:hypothetical protein
LNLKKPIHQILEARQSTRRIANSPERDNAYRPFFNLWKVYVYGSLSTLAKCVYQSLRAASHEQLAPVAPVLSAYQTK